jgi:choline dehydrogenase-like flavoprotein
VVIVGTGPGGAGAGRVLAAGGKRVVFLEEGPPQSRFRPNQANTARYHMQEGGSIVARGSNFMAIAAGRGVGGSTLINSALSFRTPDEVLAGWATLLADPGWGVAAMNPILDEVAALIGVGPTQEWFAGANNLLIARGVKALGYEGGLAPRNTPKCVGCGICNFGCPVDGKGSTNLTLLPRAVNDGALIQADTKVTEVLVEGGRAVGVRGRAYHPDTGEAGGEVIVRADIVVLSAGAIGTPRLLWFSGLGERLGPVGEGLHIHPGSAVFGLCDEEINLWKGATQGAYFHHPDLPGVLPHGFAAPPEVCLMAMGMVGDRLEEGLAMLPHLAGAVVMVSDKGTGTVRAHSDGRADVSYYFADDDVERIKRGMVVTADVLLAGGAREVFVPVHGVGRAKSGAELGAGLADKGIRDFTLYASHPMSTCRMGLDPETSVIGPNGIAHRMPGLAIADASVFPTSLGVNPQLTTLAVSTNIGHRLLRTA